MQTRRQGDKETKRGAAGRSRRHYENTGVQPIASLSMKFARLIIGVCAVGLAVGCGPKKAEVGTGPAARGNVVRDTAAARADTAKAFGLIHEGKYGDAEPLLRRAIEEDPTYGPAHNDLGIIHFHNERLYEAAWEFQNAIKLMPGQPEPHNNLGLVLESALRLQEAEKAFKEAHDLEPPNPEYAGNLAKLRLRLGEHDEQTKKLLEVVVMGDTRPDWLDWAKFNLARLQTLPQESAIGGGPATQPGGLK